MGLPATAEPYAGLLNWDISFFTAEAQSTQRLLLFTVGATLVANMLAKAKFCVIGVNCG